MMTAKSIWNNVQRVRVASPLVHNITNFVVMNNTANALLAIGASPVMAHASEEVEDMVAIASALVINIGTLSQEWVDAMALAMQAAAKKRIPIVFDPVGAGATTYRTQTCLTLLQKTLPSVIRGNASEIKALTDSEAKTKGVDSTEIQGANVAASTLAREYGCIVVVSGPTDLITDGTREHYVHNGHAMMPKVTGLGCTSTALIGAFATVEEDILTAATHAMTVMGICGEIAAETASGPASLQMNLIDSLYNLDEQQISRHL